MPIKTSESFGENKLKNSQADGDYGAGEECQDTLRVERPFGESVSLK